MMNNNLLSVNNNLQLSHSNPNLSQQQLGMETNLMRNNPGSGLDLAALYNSYNGPSNNFQSLPNVPMSLPMTIPMNSTSTYVSPIRSAPAPPPPMQNVPQIMVTGNPFNTGNQSFTISPPTSLNTSNGMLNANSDFANFNSNEEVPDGGKKTLTKVDSVASYTEPGPIQPEMEVRSPTTDEFMAILERNSAILQQASEKNQEMAIAQENKANEQKEADEAQTQDDVKFTDIVDAAGKDTTDTASEVNNDNDKEKIVPDKKEESTPVKKGIFGRWGSSKATKTPGTPPNSPVPESAPPINEASQQGRGGNEQKFMGEGQMFKGKLIGVLEVQEARGDRMCQDALQELKTAIKASGEHKQKILIHIAVDGLKIRDEKTGDCLYHHPVHKISFIAQDMSDSRAFGYIYGSPENGHRFFGIKTEKAAGQVVVAMRDLFQVVFELKQKEIDDALRKMDKKEMLPHHPASMQPSMPQASHIATAPTAASFPDGHPLPQVPGGPRTGPGPASGALSDLLGLENELTSIQAGIRQIDKIAPSAPMSFQTDSMIPIGSLQPSSNFPNEAGGIPMTGSHQPYPGLPHAPTVQQAKDLGPVTTAEAQSPINPALMAVPPQQVLQQQRPDPFGATPFLPPPPASSKSHRGSAQGRYQYPPGSNPEPQGHQAFSNNEDRYAAFEFLATSSNGFGSNNPESGAFPASNSNAYQQGAPDIGASWPQQVPATSSGMASSMDSNSNVSNELFTDLDPLGTGKSKPYVDKKDFFSELKSSSPKLGNINSESPVPMSNPSNVQGSMEVSPNNVGPSVEMSMSCPAQNQFVPNTTQRSSLRSSSGNQPTPPPRSGSELTYGSITSSDSRSLRASFGFSSHLVSSSSCALTNNPVMSASTISRSSTNTITSLASSWRTQNANSSVHDTRLYHTLGRPMTTFNRSIDLDNNSSSADSSLRISMLPDNSPQSNDQVETADKYGSIPQLEASPRRYNRLKEQNEFHYDTSGPNLTVPSRGPQPLESPQEIPPKLPEKPSRRNNQSSPPPLPPKKPIKGLIGVMSYNKPTPNVAATEYAPPDVVTGHEIYDFPPMPMLGSLKMDKEEAKQCIQDILEHQQEQPPEMEAIGPVSVEDLSKMSLIELNNKLQSGQLPEEMKGMSIVELVDYINEEMKRKANEVVEVSAIGIKPSFSDNFVCDTNVTRFNEEEPSMAQIEESSSSPVPLSATSKEVGFAFPPLNLSSSSTTPYPSLPQGSGFDDDFTPFSINSQLESMNNARPASQATSDHSVLSQSKPDEYDKYAVFRELQMEEELIKAWKTPSFEEKPEVEEEHQEQREENDEYRDQPVCSSEGSPCSRSDTQSPMKSYNGPDEQEEASKVEEAVEEADEEEEEEEEEEKSLNKRDSQVPIFHQKDDEDEESVTQSIRSEIKESNNEEEEEDSLFSTTFGSSSQEPKNSKAWTTFDDGPEEVINFPQEKAISNANQFNHENAFQDNFGDPVDWASVTSEATENEDSRKKPPIRQLSNESQHSHGKCKRFSHRNVDADHICRGHSSETSGGENAGSFTDWWPPSAEGAPPQVPLKRQVSGTGNEAYSATPDHKVAHSGCWGEDAFGEPLEAKFKIFSKVVNANPNGLDRSSTPHSNDPISDNDSGIMPKSDSVNIFSIKDDPFDDDFFH